VLLPADLDEIANPTDATYVPRPEWYFLSLFQLLKYFPGRLELIATQVVPGLIVAALVALPFLDRGAQRRPWGRGRRGVTAAFVTLAIGVAALTGLGLRDAPDRFDPEVWGPQALAGALIAEGDGATCQRCHVDGGPASPVRVTRISRDDEWLLFHMADPVAIAPGARAADPGVAPVHDDDEARAVLAYLRRLRAGAVPPTVEARAVVAVRVVGTRCVACHTIDGDGGTTGPDLSRVGARRDAAAIRRIVTNPNDEYGDSMMPVYGGRLDAAAIVAVADYLAAKR
jgi:ubiquinol-cytochrome c reductase cytochrome b subunit